MEKTVNYTEEMVTEMVTEYKANPCRETVETIAENFGKSYRSVVSKLSSEKVYKPEPRVSKDGSPVVRKEQLVNQIEGLLGIEAPSLVKASKQDLKTAVDALQAAIAA